MANTPTMTLDFLLFTTITMLVAGSLFSILMVGVLLFAVQRAINRFDLLYSMMERHSMAYALEQMAKGNMAASIVASNGQRARLQRLASVQAQLTEARMSLAVIEQRKAQYVSPTQVPLEDIKAEIATTALIAKLERELETL